MFLLPLGVVYGGYTLLWYGYSLLKGEGMGFLDLVLPSRVEKADAVIRSEWRAIPGRQTGPSPANSAVLDAAGIPPLSVMPRRPTPQPRLPTRGPF